MSGERDMTIMVPRRLRSANGTKRTCRKLQSMSVSGLKRTSRNTTDDPKVTERWPCYDSRSSKSAMRNMQCIADDFLSAPLLPVF